VVWRVKFGLKIPNCLGKMSENFGGGDFLTHTVDAMGIGHPVGNYLQQFQLAPSLICTNSGKIGQ